MQLDPGSASWRFHEKVPLVYLHGGDAAEWGKEIVRPLDDVFTCANPQVAEVGPFSLSEAASPFAYNVRVASSIWDTQDRKDLPQTFETFLEHLDSAGLKPGRLQLIRSYLSQVLPQTFGETLFFKHGFDPSRRTVEVLPGMRLRVEFEAHQAVDPEESGMNGYVGTGASVLSVGQVTNGEAVVTSFDPYLARLQNLTVHAATTGAAGAADLQSAAYRMPYWRLVYPQTYPPSDGIGSARAETNVSLIGANERTVLNEATGAYLEGRALPPEAACVWFRGRAVVIPEIPVLWAASPQYVAIGTTIRDVLSLLVPVPWLGAGAKVTSTSFRRSFSRLISESGSVRWVYGSGAVSLASMSGGGGYTSYSTALDSYDLPVLAGDRLAPA